MKELFDMIHAVLRGEYDKDMKGEHIIGVTTDLSLAGDRVYDELHAIDNEFAETLIEGLFDLAELDEFDEGTPETIAEYKRMVRELYERSLAMLKERGIALPV